MKSLIFTAENVGKILRGEKTQTRRIMKVQPQTQLSVLKAVTFQNKELIAKWYEQQLWWCNAKGEIESLSFNCPFKIGDEFYCKEAWKFADWTYEGEPYIEYADNERRLIEVGIPDEAWERLIEQWEALSDPANYDIDNRAADRKFRSPIFMPQWASRAICRVTNVRWQRIQDISDKDVIAEYGAINGWNYPGEFFVEAWDKLHGKKHPYSSNPAVWVVEFEAVAESRRV